MNEGSSTVILVVGVQGSLLRIIAGNAPSPQTNMGRKKSILSKTAHEMLWQKPPQGRMHETQDTEVEREISEKPLFNYIGLALTCVSRPACIMTGLPLCVA